MNINHLHSDRTDGAFMQGALSFQIAAKRVITSHGKPIAVLGDFFVWSHADIVNVVDGKC